MASGVAGGRRGRNVAFTGTPTVTLITESLVRITGLSLLKIETGTIGVVGSVAEVILPATFKPTRYELSGVVVSLADAIQVYWTFVDHAGGNPSPPMHAQKQSSPFMVTISNDDQVNTSPEMDIYVRYQ